MVSQIPNGKFTHHYPSPHTVNGTRLRLGFLVSIFVPLKNVISESSSYAHSIYPLFAHRGTNCPWHPPMPPQSPNKALEVFSSTLHPVQKSCTFLIGNQPICLHYHIIKTCSFGLRTSAVCSYSLSPSFNCN